MSQIEGMQNEQADALAKSALNLGFGVQIKFCQRTLLKQAFARAWDHVVEL